VLIFQVFTAFWCPSLPGHAHPVPPRQGGGHWFEPSIAHLESACKSASFRLLIVLAWHFEVAEAVRCRRSKIVDLLPKE
jgi:hypothetical protein